MFEPNQTGAASMLEMILVNTNKARNSKSTIEAVMRLRDSDNDRFVTIMEKIGQATSRILEIYQLSSVTEL